MARGGAHRGKIKRTRDVPGCLANQRIHRRMVPDKITILLAGRIEAGMEICARSRGGSDPNVLREPGIERERKLARDHIAFTGWHLEMNNHSQCMNPSICAAGTMNTRMAREQFCERFLDFFLYAGPGLLDLPAFVARAVVSDGEFEFTSQRGSLTTDGDGWTRIFEQEKTERIETGRLLSAFTRLHPLFPTAPNRRGNFAAKLPQQSDPLFASVFRVGRCL